METKNAKTAVCVDFAPVGGGVSRSSKALRLSGCCQSDVKNSTRQYTLAQVKKNNGGYCLKKSAFTLSEVLITLGIIGVVAAITMPALIANIQDRVQASRVQNIKQKFSKATDKMLSVSGLTGYDSTESFVSEFKNHLKLAKICDNSHLNECWPTKDVIINEEGKKWDIIKTKTGKQLKMINDDHQEWSDTVGIITADGTAMILSYNTKCDIDVNSRITWSGDSSNTSNCIAAVFDWNGAKMPNKFSKDVIAFNANGLGSSCVADIKGVCYGKMFIPQPISKSECESIKGQLGIKECRYDNDYWAGAVKECGGVDNMISQADVNELAKVIYGSVSGYPHQSFNSAKAQSVGLPAQPPFWIWYNTERNSERADRRSFYHDGSTIWSDGAVRTDSGISAICKL